MIRRDVVVLSAGMICVFQSEVQAHYHHIQQTSSQHREFVRKTSSKELTDKII